MSVDSETQQSRGPGLTLGGLPVGGIHAQELRLQLRPLQTATHSQDWRNVNGR